MGPGARWWWSPAALLLLLGVLTFGGREELARSEPADAVPAPAIAPSTEVVVRDAAGRRARVGLAPSQALVLSFPAALRGERVAMQVFRRVDGAREATPWLTLRPRVRADGTIPMAGLAPGDYVVEVAHDDVPQTAADVTVPGEHTFALATPPR